MIPLDAVDGGDDDSNMAALDDWPTDVAAVAKQHVTPTIGQRNAAWSATEDTGSPRPRGESMQLRNIVLGKTYIGKLIFMTDVILPFVMYNVNSYFWKFNMIK